MVDLTSCDNVSLFMESEQGHTNPPDVRCYALHSQPPRLTVPYTPLPTVARSGA